MDTERKQRLAKATQLLLEEHRDKATRLHCEYLLGTMSLDEYRRYVTLLDEEYSNIFADAIDDSIISFKEASDV